MERYKYMVVPRKMIHQAIINELDLEGLIKNDNILVEIKKGI